MYFTYIISPTPNLRWGADVTLTDQKQKGLHIQHCPHSAPTLALRTPQGLNTSYDSFLYSYIFNHRTHQKFFKKNSPRNKSEEEYKLQLVQLRQNKHTRTYTYGFLAVCCCRPSVLLNRDSNTTLSVAKCYQPISVTLVENKLTPPERKGPSYNLLYGQLRDTEIDQILELYYKHGCTCACVWEAFTWAAFTSLSWLNWSAPLQRLWHFKGDANLRMLAERLTQHWILENSSQHTPAVALHTLEHAGHCILFTTDAKMLPGSHRVHQQFEMMEQ